MSGTGRTVTLKWKEPAPETKSEATFVIVKSIGRRQINRSQVKIALISSKNYPTIILISSCCGVESYIKTVTEKWVHKIHIQ